MRGAIAISNPGKYAVNQPPPQDFVVLAAADTLQPLTTSTEAWFQKLWIYPGVTAANSKVGANAGDVYVGKKGRQIKLATVTLTLNGQTVTITATGHGLTAATIVDVILRGATPREYNGEWKATVVDANTLTYTLPNAPGDQVTGTITLQYTVELTVTPDVLAPTDGPLKYELPLGQRMRLNDIYVQGAKDDGVFYTCW